VGAFGGVAYVLVRVPLPPAAFEAQTTFLFDAQGRRLAVLHGGEDRVDVDLDEVPEVVRQAVIAAEDRDFFRHRGLDPIGIGRAVWTDVRRRAAEQGGSTITQQYVKNAYVGREKSLWRKLKEAVIAVKLERELDKREILERYLNTIYLGRGAHGVQAAARAWFGKGVGELGLPEAAYLAGLIRAPEAADVTRDPKEAARRRDDVLEAMEEEGYVTAAEREAAAAVPLDQVVRPRAARAGVEMVAEDAGTQYFVDYVRRYLSRKYTDQAVYGGGLRVETTLDLDLQRSAYQAVTRVLDRPDDPAAALVALDERGHVRAMVGGRGASQVNYAVGREGGGTGRQAGSAFKPMVLAAAVREGWSVESSFPAPATIVLPKADAGKDWPVDNYEGQGFDGSLNLVTATTNSVNTVYAQLVTALGPQKVVDTARDLGIRSPLSAVPSITLGTPTVSVLDMADAYLTFATRGVRLDPLVVTRVTTADGDVLEENRPVATRVLTREQADVVSFCLRQVVLHGTGTGADPGKPVAGKTGTTQKYGDAWFVGYTPKLSVAVWMGYPEGQKHAMTNVHGIRVTGGSLPAAVFRRFLRAALANADHGDFPAFTSFPGRIVSERVEFVDPNATTTTVPATTTTEGPPPSAPPGEATSTTPPPSPSSTVPAGPPG
jgi:penicillin-binding protein 1A